MLLCDQDVDEFCMMAMGTYGEHAVDGDEESKQPYFIKNVGSEDLGLTTDEEKKEAEEATESNAELFDVMREALGEKVERVVVSTRLTDAPAVVTSEGGVSLAMVQVLKSQPGAEGLPDLHLVLEMNAKHPCSKPCARPMRPATTTRCAPTPASCSTRRSSWKASCPTTRSPSPRP